MDDFNAWLSGELRTVNYTDDQTDLTYVLVKLLWTVSQQLEALIPKPETVDYRLTQEEYDALVKANPHWEMTKEIFDGLVNEELKKLRKLY